jgi:hypothetical protein
MGHRLWEKVRYQHKVSAPSASPAITHQSSKSFRQQVGNFSYLAALRVIRQPSYCSLVLILLDY